MGAARALLHYGRRTAGACPISNCKQKKLIQASLMKSTTHWNTCFSKDATVMAWPRIILFVANATDSVKKQTISLDRHNARLIIHMKLISKLWWIRSGCQPESEISCTELINRSTAKLFRMAPGVPQSKMLPHHAKKLAYLKSLSQWTLIID